MMSIFKSSVFLILSQQAIGQNLSGFDYLRVEMVSAFNGSSADQYMAGKVDICVDDKCEGLRRTDMVRVGANTEMTVNFATKKIPVANLNSLIRRLRHQTSDGKVTLKLIVGVFALDSDLKNPKRILPLSSYSIEFPPPESFARAKVLRNPVHVVTDSQPSSYINFNVVTGRN